MMSEWQSGGAGPLDGLGAPTTAHDRQRRSPGHDRGNQGRKAMIHNGQCGAAHVWRSGPRKLHLCGAAGKNFLVFYLFHILDVYFGHLA